MIFMSTSEKQIEELYKLQRSLGETKELNHW